MSAPLDLAALQRVLLPFGPSRLLPQEAYTSAEVLAWEQEHFFEGSWVCAGTAEGLANPGDQKAIRVGRDGILLVRGDEVEYVGPRGPQAPMEQQDPDR